ncbi:type I-E CRISPR-associated protein Cas7/Cse4/CasC [Bifidobacterium cuniculi]|uniref:CRISPR-associated Cse4 family protein n=1 Tax=Bifidobacterium cuniculi TaxID=1688 RepID=A0A087AT74_9BIFI|nr:type I-E CRISPR-associated protein Cas7/Cse4/CasC [Bifidobacterium cuniculi]KFI61974.1 CRISPR-associated Cse4 family protein [Bifidobacterium cuniculi]
MKDRTIVEIHALETTAAANLNRDDTGSPKTVNYGGVTRARVSSQAWKRPTRMLFKDMFDASNLGVRTKKVVDLLAERIAERSESMAADAAEIAELMLGKSGAGLKLSAPRKKKGAAESSEEPAMQSTYLLFLGNAQYDKLADLAIGHLDGVIDPKERETIVKSMKKEIRQTVMDDKAIDVALFGRMVADDTDMNVDAAVQVAHAISVQAVDTESDYFTAVDDAKGIGATPDDEGADNGAAMLGQVEFNAATFYRYANVDANRLYDTLGDVKATAKAVAAFVKAFVTSMPQGKSSSFAQGTLPELVVVNVRDSQAVNLVGAFERPVQPDYVENATKAFVKRSQQMDAAYGIEPVRTWVVRIGDDTDAADALADACSLQNVVDGVEAVVAERLGLEQPTSGE